MLVLFSVIFCLLFGFTFLWKSKLFIAQPNLEYLSKGNTDAVKAVCACGIVMHHIANEIDCGPVFSVFKPIGYMMVAIFFLLSGYGLVFSLNTKQYYMASFLKRRLPRILIPYSLALLIYCSYYTITGRGMQLYSIVMQFAGQWPLVRNSWFVIVLLYLYIIFWVCHKWIRSKIVSRVLFYSCVTIYSVVMTLPHWSPAIIAFLFGALVADNKSYFDKLFIQHGWPTLFGALAVFLAVFFLRIAFSGAVEAILCMIYCIAFTMFVISALTKIQLHNEMISVIGRVSFEIYLYHGLVMWVLEDIHFIAARPAVYIVLTFVLTIMIAYIMWFISCGIRKGIRRVSQSELLHGDHM